MAEIKLLMAGSLQSSPHAGQWRAQVMSDVVGDLAVGLHQFLDAIEHRVEIFREPIPLVTGAAQRYPLAEPASHNLAARRVDRFDPRDRTPRRRYSGRGSQDEKQHGGRGETNSDIFPKSVEILDIAAEKHVMAVGQDLIAHAQRWSCCRLRLPVSGSEGAQHFP